MPTCGAVCQPDVLAQRVPALSFQPREGWCSGCLLLDTPWATTSEQRKRAVGSGIRGCGAGPDFAQVGMYLSPTQGILGIFGMDGAPVAGFFVDGDLSCAAISSLRFSATGNLGVHLRGGAGMDQFLFQVDAQQSAAVFQVRNKVLTWQGSSLGPSAINDMWFSNERQAIDLAGELWLADLSKSTTSRVAALPGAPSGQLAEAAVFGTDVFVQHFFEGVTDYWVIKDNRLVQFIGGPHLDIKELVTDGQQLVWIQGSEPTTSDGGPFPVRFTHYSIYASRYTTNGKDLVPRLLVDNVDPSLSHLVMANGYVAGVYLISQPIYRAAALAVRLADGWSKFSQLPKGYSWGFEVYPAANELWGSVTDGPMVEFETVARVPYAQFQ
ncbi:MAG TPA: hypothetical protein VER12_16180 [Polyangiaceae bacterium]|nr:hypothetical protein [Polyangiaceae bacterium]